MMYCSVVAQDSQPAVIFRRSHLPGERRFVVDIECLKIRRLDLNSMLSHNGPFAAVNSKSPPTMVVMAPGPP